MLDGNATSEVLRRAQEIEAQSNLLLRPDQEVDAFVKAAEEAGIARDAVMQALRERLGYVPEELAPDTQVFAKSADGAFYVAKVLEVKGRSVRVRFLSGSDHTVDITDVRSFSLSPGQKIQYLSPSYFMWVTGELIRFNRDVGSVTGSCWGHEEVLTLDKVRMPKEVAPKAGSDATKAAIIAAVSGLIGTGIGAALMHLLSR